MVATAEPLSAGAEGGVGAGGDMVFGIALVTIARIPLAPSESTPGRGFDGDAAVGTAMLSLATGGGGMFGESCEGAAKSCLFLDPPGTEGGAVVGGGAVGGGALGGGALGRSASMLARALVLATI